MSFDSLGIPSQRALAPVEMISARDRNACWPAYTVFTGPSSSTRSMLANSNAVPKRAACFFMTSISSGPMMGFSKPG